MKKRFFVLVTIAFVNLIVGALSYCKDLPSGQQAIFLNSGTRLIGEIVDISSTRLVLQLRGGREILLSRIWMINFVNKNWYFPQELNKMETPEHYLFLKNNDIISGRIVDYSDRMRVFELEGGGKTEIGKLRRIYFSKTVPGKLSKTLSPELKHVHD